MDGFLVQILNARSKPACLGRGPHLAALLGGDRTSEVWVGIAGGWVTGMK